MTLQETGLTGSGPTADAPGWIPEWFASMPLADPLTLVRVVVLLFVGLPVILWASRTIRGWVTRTSNPQRGLVAGKLIWYVGLLAVLITVLSEMGFSLAPLLGAAGILGIALGFASQTSVSNIISGFFLMAEEPFVVGDVIELGTTRGRVLSIDMMSVKLQTLDNRFVRIPNESIIKSEVVNLTRFPIRRVDVNVGVAYKEDLDQVREVLLQVARDNPLCLMEPEPKIVFEGYGESSLNYLFAVWATRENWLELKTSIHEEIKAAFDESGIEIPFPHRTLYTGAATDPFPVRLVHSEPPASPDTAAGAGEAAPEVGA
ncbi:MAG: mechanosensitive ion channel family protein [Gemmatimonadales bacterium]|jgi:small-conductance mechanosensitive channel|nr:MAG: mechanosensitive ion channel family protein [Gemmatimonadales bacterium]